MNLLFRLPSTVEIAAASWASTGDGAATAEEVLASLTCRGGEGAFRRSSKSWARNTSGDGKASRATIVEALLLAVMAAARVGRGVAIVNDDATEMPVEGAVVVVDTVAGDMVVPGVTVEVPAFPCRGVSIRPFGPYKISSLVLCFFDLRLVKEAFRFGGMFCERIGGRGHRC